MYASCLEKQDKVKSLFAECRTPAEKYEKLMALGAELTPYPSEARLEVNRVRGCQSQMFLKAAWQEDCIDFLADSDALISKGLAALLLLVYSGETPEAILRCPPKFLEDLGIAQALSPNRANGLYSLHLRMQQEALRFMIAKG